MTTNINVSMSAAAATMNERLPGQDQTTEPPFLLFEENSDNKYWGVADRDVPILIGAAAGAVGLVFLILGAVVIWYCCNVFSSQHKKSLYSPDLSSEDISDSSSDTYPFSGSNTFNKKKMSKTSGSTKRSLSAPMNKPSVSGRRPTQEHVFTSKAYSRQLDYPSVVADIEATSRKNKTDRSHLYHPTVSSIVDSESVAMHQLAPQSSTSVDKVGQLQVRSFCGKNEMKNGTAAAIARSLVGMVPRTSKKESIQSNEATVVYAKKTLL